MGDSWDSERLLETDETNGDSLDSERLMDNNGDSFDLERWMETDETQRDYWRLMRTTGSHDTQRDQRGLMTLRD